MKFFDLLSHHSSDVKISPEKNGTSEHLLDLKNPKSHSTKRITDISGNSSKKKAFRYFATQLEHQLKASHRSLLKFAALALIIVFVFNLLSALGNAGVVLNKTKAELKETLAALSSAASEGASGNLSSAEIFFSSGLLGFENLSEQASSLLILQEGLPKDKSLLNQSSALLNAAQSLAQAAQLSLESTQRLSAYTSQVFSSTDTVSITSALRAEEPTWREILSNLQSASSELTSVKLDLLPSEYSTPLSELQTQLAGLTPLLSDTLDHLPQILDALGDQYPRRYLLLFQNCNELRPTGGFIGSVALLTLNDGHITELDIKDVYDYDGQIQEIIPPPPGFQKLTNNWGLRDSNYSPDFPTSAKQATYFLEKANGPTVDGVIAINQQLIENLLNITGPIEVEGLPVPVSSENFSTLFTFAVESKMAGVEDPKKPLKDFYPLFESKLLSSGLNQLPAFLSALLSAQKEKQILAWSDDDNLESLFSWLLLDGRQMQLSANQDYLQIVHTNVSGNKSDFFMQDSITHKTYISDDGTIEDELIINRTHAWQNIWELIWEDLAQGNWNENYYQLAQAGEGEDYASQVTPRNSLSSNDLYEIFGRGANTDYLRIYLPDGAELLSASGIDYSQIVQYQDLSKRVFSFELTTLPATTRQIRLRYRLPYRLNSNSLGDYYFFFQRQPGTHDQTLTKSIFAQGELHILASYPENLQGESIAFSKPVTADTFYSAVLGR